MPKAGAHASGKTLKTAEEGNPNHIASPMPGTVTRVAVKTGQRVGKGDVLLFIEAMKMESLVCAERERTVTHIHDKHGDTVPAKALVVESRVDHLGACNLVYSKLRLPCVLLPHSQKPGASLLRSA